MGKKINTLDSDEIISKEKDFILYKKGAGFVKNLSIIRHWEELEFYLLKDKNNKYYALKTNFGIKELPFNKVIGIFSPIGDKASNFFLTFEKAQKTHCLEYLEDNGEWTIKTPRIMEDEEFNNLRVILH